ncbi:HD domain-containing protein [Solobacterium moorei]|uniref:HD domain protein n=2 Tax=Solobacterium moorei TaxID=102148 RepID=E7MPL2_9FIRM|nr:HD domain-containing protein [Solobacterium moorei]EFW24117.1 HD domain protein [Solobacterium moorei F0204]MDI6414465.1 HD domain-containing protein [Solobacterium moorei]RGT58069.1 HD domain-containing protein [Solobacterium moorei]
MENKKILPAIAQELLSQAATMNPGPWIAHSKNVANAAKLIAQNTANIDSNYAYSLGLIHDIGRRYGFSHLKHTIDGYYYLKGLGFNEESGICLSHSFPIKIIDSYSGSNDCSENECLAIQNYLNNSEYTDYDKLIQLCDALASKDGLVIIEKRLIDVAIRNGINKYSISKWKSFLDLKTYFDVKCGKDIYKILNITI